VERIRPGDGIVDVEHEDGAHLPTKHIEIRDVEPDILPGKGRVEMMRHRGASERIGDWAALLIQQRVQ